MKNILLFLTPVFIWGSTWFVIKFQVGDVDPMYSVSYRFGIAGIIMLIASKLLGLKLSFTKKEHAFILLQGLLLFGFNYWMVYQSELYLTSGLVGLIFSLIVFGNIINGRIFLGTPFEVKVIIGGFLGIIGTALIFWNDLSHFSFSDSKILGLALVIAGVFSASLGNITSARNQKKGIPVITSNAFGMTYGAIAMFTIAFASGKEVAFIPTFEYVGSLLYLSILGSIVAFGAYLTLVGNIGASKAAYVNLLSPVIALFLSTIFEDYQWSLLSLFGALFILIGNGIAIVFNRKPKTPPGKPNLEKPAVEVLDIITKEN